MAWCISMFVGVYAQYLSNTTIVSGFQIHCLLVCNSQILEGSSV